MIRLSENIKKIIDLFRLTTYEIRNILRQR